MQFEPIEVTIKVTSVLERLGVSYLNHSVCFSRHYAVRYKLIERRI